MVAILMIGRRSTDDRNLAHTGLTEELKQTTESSRTVLIRPQSSMNVLFTSASGLAFFP